jgi:hypothetical protein
MSVAGGMTNPREDRFIINEATQLLDAHKLIVVPCPKYEVLYSDVTGEFYVSARIEVINGGILSSICEHRRTPQQAVIAFAERLKEVNAPSKLVTNAYDRESRRHWRYAVGFGGMVEVS